MNLSTAKTRSKGSSVAASTVERGTTTGNGRLTSDRLAEGGAGCPDVFLGLRENIPNIQRLL
jgi:hypothetical protein